MTKKDRAKLNPALIFVIKFVGLFAFFYGFYLFYLSVTAVGGDFYTPFFSEHLNFIAWQRHFLISTSSHILQLMGYQTKTGEYQLLVVGNLIIRVGYDCLGFGVMAFIASFMIAYPKQLSSKLIFFIALIAGLQILNIARFILLTLYWRPGKVHAIDHHLIFDVIIYIIIAVSIYLWVSAKPTNRNATN